MKKKATKPSKYSNVTRNDIAVVFGVSVRTVTRWLEAGFPRKKNGRYDLTACIQWKLDEQAMASAPGEPASPELERFRRLRADLLQIELDERAGSLAPIDEVFRGWCARYRLVRDGLLSWVNRLPPLLSGLEQAEIGPVLKTEIYNLLNSFAKNGQWSPPVDETCDDAPGQCALTCQKGSEE